MTKTLPELGAPAMHDNMTEILAGVASSAPIIGPIVAAAIKDIIPNIRLERIEAYIKHLQSEVDELQIKLALETEEGLDTFEEGLWQAARALSEERKKHISKLVSTSFTAEETQRQQARHFLRILKQIGDEDLAVLIEYYKGMRGGLLSTPWSSGEDEQLSLGLLEAREKLLQAWGLIAVFGEDWNASGRSGHSETTYDITFIGRQFLEFLGISNQKSE